MSARVDRATSTLWNPTGSEERPLSGEERKCHALSPTSPKPQQQPFSASHGEGAHRIASIQHAQRRKLIPYGELALERAVAGRGAKLAFNELGAISFPLRGRGDRTAT